MTQMNLSHWSILRGYPRIYLRYFSHVKQFMQEGLNRNDAEKSAWHLIVKLLSRIDRPAFCIGRAGRKTTIKILCESCCRQIVTKKATEPICRFCKDKRGAND